MAEEKNDTLTKTILLTEVQIDIFTKIISEKNDLTKQLNKLEEREADFSTMLLDFVKIDKSKVVSAVISNGGKELIVSYNV